MKQYRKTIYEYRKALADAGLFVAEDLEPQRSDTLVRNLTFDSRKVSDGTLFICKGKSFKPEYLRASFEKGAVAAVSETDYGLENTILVSDIRRAMAVLSNLFFDNPSAEIPVAAFTGTKGKSTSLYFLKAIMEASASCGEGKFGYISTIDTYDGKEKFKSVLTTPEAVEIGLRLRNMADCGLKCCAMEVSSQALKYDRSYGLIFDIACFTNFGPDHIGEGEHKDVEDYFASKLKIFDQTRIAVVNLDSERAAEILAAAKKGRYVEKVITFSAKDDSADYVISDLRKEDGFTVFHLSGVGEIRLSMPGMFNAENAAAAAVMAKHFGAENREIIDALLWARAEGRMEVFSDKRSGVTAIADYAHNALSFEELYKSVKQEYPGSRIVAVFGAPGNKAYTRREDLPRVSAKYADYVYLTEDDPAYENPSAICSLLLENLKKYGGNGEIILNREEAVRTAIEKAPRNTVVLLMAKGNETYMKRENRLDPIRSDAQIAEELLVR